MRHKQSLLFCLGFAGVAAIFLSGCNLLGGGGPSGPTTYRTTSVTQDMVRKTVSATGVLTPWYETDIKSRAGGQVTTLPVTDGEILKKGQLIATIDPTDTLLTYNTAKASIAGDKAVISQNEESYKLQLQQSELNVRNAEAALKSAQAQAQASQANYRSSQTTANNSQALSTANIDNARATLAAQQAKLTQLQSATNPQAVAAANADLNQAKANLVNANAQLKRQEALLKQGFIAQSSVDQAIATREVAAAAVETAQEKVNTIAPELAQDVSVQQAQVNQAKAALQTALAQQAQVKVTREAALAAKANADQSVAAVRQANISLQNFKAQRINNQIRYNQIAQSRATLVGSQAAFSNAQIQLDDTHVTAPWTGVLLQKYIEQGTYITSGMSFNSSGTNIVQMGDISRMYVDTSVDETDIANIQMGQKVEITFDAYPTLTFDGKVILIEPMEVIASNVTTLHVRVEVDNSTVQYRLLRPGMNATCEFIVDQKDNVICVPNEAVQTDSQGNSYVLVAVGGKEAPATKDTPADPTVLAGCKIENRPVQIGLQGDDTTEVTSGLKPGEIVVTETIKPAGADSGMAGFGGGGPGPGRK